MSERRGHRPPLLILFATVAALALGGCSGSTDDPATTVIQSVPVSSPAADPAATGATEQAGDSSAASAAATVAQPSAGAGGITVVAPPAGVATAGQAADTGVASGSGSASASGTNPSAQTGTSPAPTTATTATTAAKPKPKPKPAAQVFTSPKAGAKNVDPRQKITVAARGGTVVAVKVINPEKKVVGHATVNARSWSWLPELGFGRTYTVRTTSKSTAGVVTTTDSTFTTLMPARQVSATVTPGNGQTVGVGQPIVIRFSAPISDSYRRKVEAMIRIDRTIGQAGAFRWFSSTEVHWRPAQFWKSGSKVVVRLDIYAKQLSPGSYGAADLVSRFGVGPRITSIVDAKKHTMEVYKDFKLIRVIPVSLGNDKYPTYNGIHVVTEKYREYVMDSSTWGLKGVGAYRTKVKYATRISDSGEFVHGAPWSEYAQGKSNVSHGCINMTDAAAHWFQNITRPGDVVTVKNSVGKTMDVGDRYGDWNQPWGKY